MLLAKAKVSPEGTALSAPPPTPCSGPCARLSSRRTALSLVEIFPYRLLLPRAAELGDRSGSGVGKGQMVSALGNYPPCPQVKTTACGGSMDRARLTWLASLIK